MSTPSNLLLTSIQTIAANIAAATTTAQLARVRADLLTVARDVDQMQKSLALVTDEFRQAHAALKDRRRALTDSVVEHTSTNHLDASTHLERAWSLFRQARYIEAEERARSAMTLAATDPDGSAYLGWALALQGKLDDAARAAQDALLLDPTHVAATLVQGIIAMERELHGEAIEHLTRIQETTGKFGRYARLYLGHVYLKRQMADDAVEILTRALKSAPNLIEARYHLGHAFKLQGDLQRAYEAWQLGANATSLSPWSVKCENAARLIAPLIGHGLPKR